MASEPLGRLIYITHFFNPNCFYFKLHDEFFNDDLHKLESEVAVYANRARKLSRSKLFTPLIDFTVAAYIIEAGKWVRAKINKLPSESNGSMYTALAIDHGIVIRVAPYFICSLPPDLIERRVCGSAMQGSVYRTVPASKELDITTLDVNYVPAANWSVEAVSAFESLHTSGVRVFFKVHQKIDNYCFGDLSLLKDNRTIELKSIYEDKLKVALPIELSICKNEMEKIVARYSIGIQKKIVHSDQHKQNRKSTPISVEKAACMLPKYSEEKMHQSSMRVPTGSSSSTLELENVVAASAGDDEGNGNASVFDFQSEINGGVTLMSTAGDFKC